MGGHPASGDVEVPPSVSFLGFPPDGAHEDHAPIGLAEDPWEKRRGVATVPERPPVLVSPLGEYFLPWLRVQADPTEDSHLFVRHPPLAVANFKRRLDEFRAGHGLPTEFNDAMTNWHKERPQGKYIAQLGPLKGR